MKNATFELNACYTVRQAAEILQLHPKTVLRLCSNRRIQAASHPGGYRITGFAIKEYCEGRLPAGELTPVYVSRKNY